MSSEKRTAFLCIWKDNKAVQSQTMPLCKEVDPYQEILWFHTQGQKERVEEHTAGSQGQQMSITMKTMMQKSTYLKLSAEGG